MVAAGSQGSGYGWPGWQLIPVLGRWGQRSHPSPRSASFRAMRCCCGLWWTALLSRSGGGVACTKLPLFKHNIMTHRSPAGSQKKVLLLLHKWVIAASIRGFILFCRAFCNLNSTSSKI
jgi:hypothetical protein